MKGIATTARLHVKAGAYYRVDTMVPAPAGMRAVFYHESVAWEAPVLALGTGRRQIDEDGQLVFCDESDPLGFFLDGDGALQIVEGEDPDQSGCFVGYRFAQEGSLEAWIEEHAETGSVPETGRSEAQKAAMERVRLADAELRAAHAAFAVAAGWAEAPAGEGGT
jgi:hypothetical protein